MLLASFLHSYDPSCFRLSSLYPFYENIILHLINSKGNVNTRTCVEMGNDGGDKAEAVAPTFKMDEHFFTYY